MSACPRLRCRLFCSRAGGGRLSLHTLRLLRQASITWNGSIYLSRLICCIPVAKMQAVKENKAKQTRDAKQHVGLQGFFAKGYLTNCLVQLLCATSLSRWLFSSTVALFECSMQVALCKLLWSARRPLPLRKLCTQGILCKWLVASALRACFGQVAVSALSRLHGWR